MSGIGFSELIILFLIGLIVLGPERLPRVANQVGSWLGQARRMTRVMKRQLEEELDLEKAPSIKPDAAKKTVFPPKSADDLSPEPPPEHESANESSNEHDDTYSPAHEPDAPGTGVDDEVVEDEPADTVVADTDSDSAEPEKIKEPAS